MVSKFLGFGKKSAARVSLKPTTVLKKGMRGVFDSPMDCHDVRKEPSPGCEPPNFITSIWGRTEVVGGALTFTKQLSGKSERVASTHANGWMQGKHAGPFFVHNPNGFKDVHAYADALTGHVCSLEFYPNRPRDASKSDPDPPPVVIGVDAASHHHRRTKACVQPPGTRRAFRFRIIYQECRKDERSFLKDLQTDYVDDEGNFSSSDGRPYDDGTASAIIMDEVPDVIEIEKEGAVVEVTGRRVGAPGSTRGLFGVKAGRVGGSTYAVVNAKHKWTRNDYLALAGGILVVLLIAKALHKNREVIIKKLS